MDWGGKWRSFFFGVETVEWQRDRDVLRVCGHLFLFSADIVFSGKGGRGVWRAFFGVLAVKLVESVFRCAYSGVSMKIGFCPATGFWKGTSGIFFWGGIVGAV